MTRLFVLLGFAVLCALITGLIECDNVFENPASSAKRANAVVVILARNSDLWGLKRSLSQFEERFNKKYQYPYVFLNEVEFTDEFKNGVRKLISGDNVEFGLIPEEHWSYPSWIDVEKADRERIKMKNAGVVYGGLISYRHMCRFNSGFFFQHALLKQYDYYWRVEPGVDFTCDVDYDPFVFMEENGKDYGFNIMFTEHESTIPTLWDTTKKFMKENPQLIHPRNVMKKLFEGEDGGYNLCHFWSNFEIASLKFLRSDEYMKYFDYLDQAGGFFYERWGDAPVHSLAVGMFLPKERIHFFENIGYYHAPFGNCPVNAAAKGLNCQCDLSKNVDNHCMNNYYKLQKEQ